MEKIIKENLEKIKSQYYELEKRINVLSSQKEFSKIIPLSKQLSFLEEIVKKYEEYTKFEKNREDLKVAITSEKNRELIEMYKEELKDLEKKLLSLFSEIKTLLIPKDSLDERNVLFEMRGAAGGDESNIFVGDLFRAYSKYFENLNWKIDIIESHVANSGGYSFLSFFVKGKNVYSKLKFEAGVHRVQRVPKTESQGRVHTSTISIAVLPEAEDIDVKINPSDLKIDTYRASGAGGQHINTTDSAVRITHIPTGVVVSSQDGRSQHDNKNKALLQLKTKIFETLLEEKQKEAKETRLSAIGSGARSEKIRTYNYPQNRVTDHRISFTINNLDKVMEGKFDEIIQALITHEQASKLNK